MALKTHHFSLQDAEAMLTGQHTCKPHLAPLGSQSQCRIWFILATQRAGHDKKCVYLHDL